MVNVGQGLRYRILLRLRNSEGLVSGQDLANELGISRVAVWKHVESLRRHGYEIGGDSAGYRLQHGGDFIYPWEISYDGEIYYRTQLASTMDVARDLAFKGRGKALVIAESQSAGRGHDSHGWDSRPGGLFFSLLSRPSLCASECLAFLLAQTMGLCQAIGRAYGLGVGVKWPNDVYLGDRKLAGLLPEYWVSGDGVKAYVMGIGINVNNECPGIEAISLSRILNRPLGRAEVLSIVLPGIEGAALGDFSPAVWAAMECQGPWRLESANGQDLGGYLGLDQWGRAQAMDPLGNCAAYTMGKAHLQRS